MRHTKIIGFRGKKGVGKNFVASRVEYLIGSSLGKTVELGAFADPIKKFLIDNLYVEYEWCYGTDANKNTLTKYDWELMFDDVRRDNGKHSGPMSAREVMQVFGTDICRRIFGSDIWVQAMKRRIDRSEADFFLITDVRFANEVKIVRDTWGGQVWQIIGPQRGEESAKKDSHPSESQVDLAVPVDVLVENGIGRQLDDLNRSLMEGLRNV
jgi:hypothetical protein